MDLIRLEVIQLSQIGKLQWAALMILIHSLEVCLAESEEVGVREAAEVASAEEDSGADSTTHLEAGVADSVVEDSGVVTNNFSEE